MYTELYVGQSQETMLQTMPRQEGLLLGPHPQWCTNNTGLCAGQTGSNWETMRQNNGNFLR